MAGDPHCCCVLLLPMLLLLLLVLLPLIPGQHHAS
jgi:hypothetical protein